MDDEEDEVELADWMVGSAPLKEPEKVQQQKSRRKIYHPRDKGGRYAKAR